MPTTQGCTVSFALLSSCHTSHQISHPHNFAILTWSICLGLSDAYSMTISLSNTSNCVVICIHSYIMGTDAILISDFPIKNLEKMTENSLILEPNSAPLAAVKFILGLATRSYF